MSGEIAGTGTTLFALVMVGLTVYATRILGLLLAPLLNRLPRTRRVIQVLPGCALAAVIAPPTVAAAPVQIAAVAITFGLYWFTRRAFVALGIGCALLVAGAHLGWS